MHVHLQASHIRSLYMLIELYNVPWKVVDLLVSSKLSDNVRLCQSSHPHHIEVRARYRYLCSSKSVLNETAFSEEM